MPSPKRILIIEDNTDDEAILMRQLKKAGLGEHIEVIHDGGEALKYLSDNRDDCEQLAAIFLDLRLPTIHGLHILEAIKSSERLEHVPVIIMASSNLPEELERCRALGASNYVCKPLTVSSFAKAFADTFHAKRAATEPAPLRFAGGVA